MATPQTEPDDPWRPPWAVFIAVLGILASTAAALWGLWWVGLTGGQFFAGGLVLGLPLLVPSVAATALLGSYLWGGSKGKFVGGVVVLALVIPGLVALIPHFG